MWISRLSLNHGHLRASGWRHLLPVFVNVNMTMCLSNFAFWGGGVGSILPVLQVDGKGGVTIPWSTSIPAAWQYARQVAAWKDWSLSLLHGMFLPSINYSDSFIWLGLRSASGHAKKLFLKQSSIHSNANWTSGHLMICWSAVTARVAHVSRAWCLHVMA